MKTTTVGDHILPHYTSMLHSINHVLTGQDKAEAMHILFDWCQMVMAEAVRLGREMGVHSICLSVFEDLAERRINWLNTDQPDLCTSPHDIVMAAIGVLRNEPLRVETI